MTKKRFPLAALMFVAALLFSQFLSAQANLSFQGILKKANGLAVDDGDYDLTFTLYDVETGGTVANEKHKETISGVEVAGGIYSVILGAQAGSPLAAAFDVPYYLGIRVGGPSATEMLPRIRLTSAPYALALRGSSNVFPGSGTVQADKIEVNGGVLAEGGAPGLNGANNNGYAFKDNNGDNDSGLFSTGDGTVSLYANNSERILVSNTAGDNRTYLKSNVTVDNSLTISDQLIVTSQITANSNLNFASNDGLQYNGVSDWRLVDMDIFSSGNAQGWGSTTGLNNSTDAPTAPVVENFGNEFNGYALRPSNESDVLKKEFTLNRAAIGNYSQIRIKFKYYFLDSWDSDGGGEGPDIAIGCVSTTKDGATMAIAWSQIMRVYDNGVEALDFYDSASNFSDATTVGEMVVSTRNNSDSNFWVFFGAKMVGNDDETYAIGDIEVWVR